MASLYVKIHSHSTSPRFPTLHLTHCCGVVCCCCAVRHLAVFPLGLHHTVAYYEYVATQARACAQAAQFHLVCVVLQRRSALVTLTGVYLVCVVLQRRSVLVTLTGVYIYQVPGTMDQPTNQSTNQSINQSIHPSLRQSINQPINP